MSTNTTSDMKPQAKENGGGGGDQAAKNGAKPPSPPGAADKIVKDANRERHNSNNQRRVSTKEGEWERNCSTSSVQHRQRRRTNTRHDSDATPEGRKSTSGGGGGKKKEWVDRKSFSQQDKNGSGSRERNGSERRTHSTTSNGAQKTRMTKQSTASVNSNGDGLDYGNYEDLDEPFSDSDSESGPRGPQKMQLPIPRGRIRTLSGTVPIVGYSPKWGGPTMCLSCLHFFDLPEDIETFSEHLLKEHHIVVSEIDLIVDPKRYIEHWRQRFAKESIDNIFPRIEPAEGTPFHGKTEYYFEMSAKLPEDFQVRQRLAMRRLEEALSCQQREREDTNFSLQCIFCRYTARGNRSKIIHHLYMIHHLNLGSPDNLVFVTEYIEHLKEKLVRNECIYCEKIFADRNTLMDHMRKRNHREVNPRNHYYDKFYIINYLELGKRWLDVLAEDFEDAMPAFQDSDEEEEDQSWHEWQEDNLDDETRVLCLCCEESTDCLTGLLGHMKEKHGLDLVAQCDKEGYGTYERAKVINFIRKQNYNSCCWVCGAKELGNWMAVYKHIDDKHRPIPSLPDRLSWDTEEELVGLFGNDHLVWMLESAMQEKEEAQEDASTPTEPEARVAAALEFSKKNTIEGVIAEDFPDLPELAEIDQLF